MSVSCQPHQSSLFGLDANIAAALSYVASIILAFIPFVGSFSWLAPLVLYLVEKNSGFVKKHAMQAFLLGCVSGIASLIYAVGIIFFSLFGLTSSVTAALHGAGEAAVANSVIVMILPLLIGTLLLLAVAVLLLTAKIFGIIGAAKYQEVKIPLVSNLADRIMKTNRSV